MQRFSQYPTMFSDMLVTCSFTPSIRKKRHSSLRCNPDKKFNKLWCLYDDQVDALARRLEGRSMKTSKQSIITATLLPKEARKHSGIVLCKSFRSGHNINGRSRNVHPSNPLEKNAGDCGCRNLKTICHVLC